jgi:Flp pilus assembly pilin Flp
MLGLLNSDTRAVTALEYGMIGALIAVIAISGFTGVGKDISSKLSSVNASM